VYGFAAIDRDATWSPALILGVMRVWRSGFEEPGGTASFALDAASIDLCPFKFGASALEARMCGSALFGRLSVTGTETRNSPGTLARPFALAGAAALLTLRLNSTIELTSRAAVSSTLIRDSFEFAPRVFHTAAPVTVGASMGIGFRSR
jgi:hypothetical protein